MKEIWKPAKGLEDRFEVSNRGRVRNIHSGTILKPFIACGYRTIRIYIKDNKEKNFSIHRLVAVTFIPNPENKPQVNHIDGIKTNNNVENLEWVTPKENADHAFRTGLRTAIGSKHPNSKLTEAIVEEIKRDYVRGSKQFGARSLARKYGVNQKAIYSIIHNETWTHVKSER